MEDKQARAELRKIGATLRAARLEAGLSQERVAEIADVDRTYIGRIENGLVNASWESISRLARALGLKPGAVIARSGV
jgi:transcriptional regulator with XRE-family HTH domain